MQIITFTNLQTALMCNTATEKVHVKQHAHRTLKLVSHTAHPADIKVKPMNTRTNKTKKWMNFC